MQLIINIGNESGSKDIEILRFLLKKLNISFSESKDKESLKWFVSSMPELDVQMLNDQIDKSRTEWERINI